LTLKGLQDDAVNPDEIEIYGGWPIQVFRGLLSCNDVLKCGTASCEISQRDQRASLARDTVVEKNKVFFLTFRFQSEASKTRHNFHLDPYLDPTLMTYTFPKFE
jgi:hypothetical protein